MSRSGYIDDYDDQWALIKYRGRVASAIRGKRGQAFLLEMLRAMDALPEKKLIANDLARRVPPPFPGGSVLGQIWSQQNEQWEVCAIGSVGLARGIDMSKLDPEDADTVSATFGIHYVLATEIVYMNDEASWRSETPEQRFIRMRKWIVDQIKPV